MEKYELTINEVAGEMAWVYNQLDFDPQTEQQMVKAAAYALSVAYKKDFDDVYRTLVAVTRDRIDTDIDSFED